MTIHVIRVQKRYSSRAQTAVFNCAWVETRSCPETALTGSHRTGGLCSTVYWAVSIAPATFQTYSQAIGGSLASVRIDIEAGLQPLPLSENLLSMLVAYLASEGLSHQTIKSYLKLSAIRYFSIMAGHGDPFTPGAFSQLQYVLRGIKRSPHQPARVRLPITPTLLRAMRSVWLCAADIML